MRVTKEKWLSLFRQMTFAEFIEFMEAVVEYSEEIGIIEANKKFRE